MSWPAVEAPKVHNVRRAARFRLRCKALQILALARNSWSGPPQKKEELSWKRRSIYRTFLEDAESAWSLVARARHLFLL